jgi:hypothetical protein
MVTPLDADPDTLHQDVTTRITLRLSGNTSALYQKLLDAVADMPDTTILFLQRLRKIHINTTLLDGEVTRATIEKRPLARSANMVKLIRSQNTSGAPRCDVSLYRCVKHVITDMPKDGRRKGRNSAPIELAFPIHPITQQPKLNELGQHVFAYLPLQRLRHIQVSSTSFGHGLVLSSLY